MAAQSFDQLLTTRFNALSLEQKPQDRVETDDDNRPDSSLERTPSLRKSQPPSLKLDIARPFVTRTNQVPQAPPAPPASSRLPDKQPDLRHGNLNLRWPAGTPASLDSTPSDPISPDHSAQHDSTPVNQRPRSETVDFDASILCWRPTYMQSPRLPESPPANSTRSGGQRRESDSSAWQQQCMESYLHQPSPEFMPAGHNFGEAPQSKDKAPEISSSKGLI